MEESVVPCYLDGYLWETYSVQFLSTLCAHKEGMAEEKKKNKILGPDRTGWGRWERWGKAFWEGISISQQWASFL